MTRINMMLIELAAAALSSVPSDVIELHRKASITPPGPPSSLKYKDKRKAQWKREVNRGRK